MISSEVIAMESGGLANCAREGILPTMVPRLVSQHLPFPCPVYTWMFEMSNSRSISPPIPLNNKYHGHDNQTKPNPYETVIQIIDHMFLRANYMGGYV